MTAPLAPVNPTELHDQFVESVDEVGKMKLLEKLARTPASTTRDVQSLFDLFMRFPDSQVRDAALASLSLTNFQSPDLDVLLVHYLQQPESEAKIFAIKGAVRCRDSRALPLIKAIAEKKFSFKSAGDADLLSDKNAWWVQYEALAALAQWTGQDAMPLLTKKTEQAPEVARLIGRYLWKDSLPVLLGWANGGSTLDQDRARAGLAAPAPTPELRKTRDRMLAVLRDTKAPREARHQLALKIGLSSTHEEVEALLKEYQNQKSEEDKLMFKAALFASRDNAVIPLLKETAKEDGEARNRAGAIIELKDMLPPKELKTVLDWSLANDPDPDNRDLVEHELRLIPR
jgi:hypothetical protein